MVRKRTSEQGRLHVRTPIAGMADQTDPTIIVQARVGVVLACSHVHNVRAGIVNLDKVRQGAVDGTAHDRIAIESQMRRAGVRGKDRFLAPKANKWDIFRFHDDQTVLFDKRIVGDGL
jgi:hypothetical protein